MNRYKTIDNKFTEEGKKYISNPIYPNIPPTSDDSYVMTTDGDRYDTLAKEFYNDITLWWVIASANKFNNASLALEPGIQLRVPADPEKAVTEFIELNNNR